LLVLRQGIVLACIGAGIGFAVAFPLTRLMKSLLFGVSPLDPLVFITVAVVCVAAALLACLLPARRAAEVDPLILLRYE
jgi:ABC-type antimicrobial peptide transport system permease subunit